MREPSPNCFVDFLFQIIIVSSTRALFQYPLRRLIVRSREVSKPRDRQFKLSYRCEIWLACRQQCCLCACQISQRSDYSKYKSRGVETSQDLMIRRLIGYWNGALLIWFPDNQAHPLTIFTWIRNPVKLCNARVHNVLSWWQHFAHVTKVTMSWRENFVVIGGAHFNSPEQSKFWSKFEFDRNTGFEISLVWDE